MAVDQNPEKQNGSVVKRGYLVPVGLFVTGLVFLILAAIVVSPFLGSTELFPFESDQWLITPGGREVTPTAGAGCIGITSAGESDTVCVAESPTVITVNEMSWELLLSTSSMKLDDDRCLRQRLKRVGEQNASWCLLAELASN